MNINIKNPIIFLDIESTGMDIVNDRIVEISYLKIHLNGTKVQRTIRVNPTIPVSPEAMQVHKISDEDLASEPTFKEIARQLANEFEGCDLAGYNISKFDLPMMAEEFLRAEVDIDFKNRKCIDVQIIFYKKEPRTLEAAYKYYCNKTLENAHSAEADAMATYEVLEAQLERYKDLENDVGALAKFSAHNNNADYAGRIIFGEDGKELFNFGKYKGQPVADVLKKDPGYYGWIINGEFPMYTKKIITAIKLRQA